LDSEKNFALRPYCPVKTKARTFKDQERGWSRSINLPFNFGFLFDRFRIAARYIITHFLVVIKRAELILAELTIPVNIFLFSHFTVSVFSGEFFSGLTGIAHKTRTTRINITYSA
jgi:hypothetical protein